MSRLRFELEKEAPGSRARAGRLHAIHGTVETPVFMPVGTQATVKSQTFASLRASGSRILLANTYHLMLRPGPEVFRKLGGIHHFMSWDGPVLTDSGGFQIFSLDGSRRMTEEGAIFKSHLDGRIHLLSPEKSIEMQRAIGSDIMMVLDQCIPSTADRAEAQAALELTHRWARRSLDARGDSPQSLFGIVQGASFQDLRRISAETLSELPFDGFAIGGLAVGESAEERKDLTEWTAALMPRELPRYLMGVGTPTDILEAVHRGVDLFDCILPSQFARRGAVFTSRGKIQIRRGVYRYADEPLDPDCSCETCQSHSRAYLHHLQQTEEVLGWTLLTTHNLTYYHRMMREIRRSILEGHFSEYYRRKLIELGRADDENPITRPRVNRARARAKAERGTALGEYEISQEGPAARIRHLPSQTDLPEKGLNREDLESIESRLPGKGRSEDEQVASPLVIWDWQPRTGERALGIIRLLESRVATRPVWVISLALDLDPLRLAARHPVHFPHLKHRAPAVALSEGTWSNEAQGIRWEVRHGPLPELLQKLQEPDLIFCLEPEIIPLRSAVSAAGLSGVLERAEIRSTE